MLSDSVYSGAVLKTLRRFIILVAQEQDSDNAAAAAVASWAAKHPWRYALSMRFKMLSSWVPG